MAALGPQAWGPQCALVCDLRPSPWPVTGDGQARGRQHVPFPYPQCGDVGAPGGQGGDAGDKLRAALAHSASVTRVVAALGASGHGPGAGVQGPPNSEPQASLAPWRVRAGAAGGAWAQAISGSSRRGSDVFFSVWNKQPFACPAGPSVPQMSGLGRD